jgi:hypothetical protein
MLLLTPYLAPQIKSRVKAWHLGLHFVSVFFSLSFFLPLPFLPGRTGFIASIYPMGNIPKEKSRMSSGQTTCQAAMALLL